jgi:16S rRNA (cytosine967-C5)-methyltransferase
VAGATEDGGPDATAGDPVAAAAATTSHPEWLARLIATDVGPADLEALLGANNEPAPTALRVHAEADDAAVAAELAASGVTTRPGRWARSALVVTGGAAALRRHPLLADGTVTVQGEASQLVVRLLEPRAGERIVDLCAAPGGKAGAIAERVGDEGLVVGIDPTPGGARRVRAHVARVGGRGALAVAADGRRPPLRGGFDAVLVDAPCSGLGTLRRHPEIRWRRRPEDLPRLAALQAELLDAAAGLVRSGGRLVYAVCTLTRAETWDVVEPWLARHPAFRVEPAAENLDAGTAALVHRDALRTLPVPHGLDGFFAVRLRAGE